MLCFDVHSLDGTHNEIFVRLQYINIDSKHDMMNFTILIETMKKGFDLFIKGSNANSSEPTPADEDFTDCEALQNINTFEKLKNFEKLVDDSVFRGKMIRFLKKVFPTSSYKDRKSFFTTVWCYLLDVNLIIYLSIYLYI